MEIHKWVLVLGVLGACDVASGEAPETAGADDQASFSYFPMGFARVSAGGVVGARFNSAGPAPFVSSHTRGNYALRFPGLGIPISADASHGNVQVTAEGTSNIRCEPFGWGVDTDLWINVECFGPDDLDADSAFAVQYFRYAMPAANPWPTTAAYTEVDWAGGMSMIDDYNSSGSHNTAARTGTGSYTVTIANATASNASVMVSPIAWPFSTHAMCSVASWTGNVIGIACRNRFGDPYDTSFALSYSVTGPTRDQQGGHARFNGKAIDTTRSAALGKVEGCSPASITGSPGSLATITLSGEIGSWDATPFQRASFATRWGAAGYCKIESLTNSEGATSTSSSGVRCYNPDGTAVGTPAFLFTQVTSDAAGPC